MRGPTPTGVVIFTGQRERLAKFYQAVTGLPVRTKEGKVTVLGTGQFQIVVHDLAGEPPGAPSRPRRDSYVKPYFEVESLAEIRTAVDALGGQAEPPSREWTGGRFRAFEALDPDGNPIQFRAVAP
jgi:predicted enzyme related to lactoylglutathione lyase